MSPRNQSSRDSRNVSGQADTGREAPEEDFESAVLLEDDELALARLFGEAEAHRRTRRRLVGALDQVLPLAKAYLLVEPAHGGPASTLFVPDPEDAGSLSLPEIIEAERVLFAAAAENDGEGEEDGHAGFETYSDADFLDVPEAVRDEHAADPVPDTLEGAVVAAAGLIERLNAHRIAGLEPTPDLLDRYSAALGEIARRLPPPSADPVNPGPDAGSDDGSPT